MRIVYLTWILGVLCFLSCLSNEEAKPGPKLNFKLSRQVFTQDSLNSIHTDQELIQGDTLVLELSVFLNENGKLTPLANSQNPWDFLEHVQWNWNSKTVSNGLYFRVIAKDTGSIPCQVLIIDKNHDSLRLSDQFFIHALTDSLH